MKILILTNYANGLYLFRKELLEQLQNDGHQISVAVPVDENTSKIEKLGCKVIDVQLERRGNNPIKDYRLFHTYVKLLKSYKPDIVFTYTIKPNLYGGLACSLKKIAYICNITGLGTAIENQSLMSKILLAFYRISTKKAQCVFFQNEKNRDFMNHFKIACTNNQLLPGSGVNLQEHPFVEYPSEKFGICFLAVIRIMKDKGIEEYLSAAEIMKKRYPKVRFVLVGEYEEETRTQYESQINDLVKKNVISYLGHIDNVKDVMASSHVIVHPSYHEGLSNVLLEAAACGRPVLASDVHGCVETFEQGESGIAFSSKDTQALVRAMETIMSFTEEKRRQMGIKGRKWVENHFDRNIVIEAYRAELQKTEHKR